VLKKLFKIIAVNIVIFITLLILLEISLRLFGFKTIFQMENEDRKNTKIFQRVCTKLETKKLTVYDSFLTDGDGIFKANFRYHYNLNPKTDINTDGFRGNSFKPVEKNKTTILMVGDSFTWGASALPIQNSFADLVHNAGYHVYNGGIPGTGVNQYAKIIEKYTPILKPDIVAVFLYLGNDLRGYPDPMIPYKNIHFVTNFGYLRGYDEEGHFFKNGAEAFEYVKKRYCGCTPGLIDRFLYRTVIGKAVYGILQGPRQIKVDYNKTWITDSWRKIQQVCQNNHSRFLLFIIPVVKRNERKTNSLETNINRFKSFKPFYPAGLLESDYCQPPDNHFNNIGHRKYADFILRVLKENESPRLER